LLDIITHENPRSLIAEAYRVLRTNIMFSSVDNPLKSFVITSFGNGEGKTTTVVNLAVTFSQQGSRVLLIDGDLRKPRLHSIFNFENDRGLTNFLSAHDNYKDYVKLSYIDKLDVLVCGAIPPNPSELLMSASMKQFIVQAKNDYDIVLVDTPPVGLVTDAAILSAIVDGTILVAASGGVSVDALMRAKELLGKVNANIIGVVLNKLGKNNSDNYYRYDYYDYESNGNKKHKTKHKI
jgi:capsular exopolysaccharide synthesis family protein